MWTVVDLSLNITVALGRGETIPFFDGTQLHYLDRLAKLFLNLKLDLMYYNFQLYRLGAYTRLLEFLRPFFTLEFNTVAELAHVLQGLIVSDIMNFLRLWWINPICNMPHFKAWLMVVTSQVLRRHCSLLRSEVYVELTQLELMVNDSCWLPPGTHLCRIKVFLLTLASARVIHCNELCPATQVLRESGDLMLTPHTALTRYHCRIEYNYGNVSAPSAAAHRGSY